MLKVTSLKHTTYFIKWKFKVSDIDIRKIDMSLLPVMSSI